MFQTNIELLCGNNELNTWNMFPQNMFATPLFTVVFVSKHDVSRIGFIIAVLGTRFKSW